MRLRTTVFSKPWAPFCFARKISAVPPSAILRRIEYRDCRVIRGRSSDAQSNTPGGGLGRSWVAPLRAVFLARLDGEAEAILRRRQGTRRVGRERARWRIGPVEVEHERAIRLAKRAHEAARAVGLV